MKKLFYITVTITLGLLFSCNTSDIKGERPDSLTTAKLHTAPSKYLTIVFLDISGSFNKNQSTGGFKGKNYFDEACNELINRIRYNIKIGEECLIVKAIQNQSFKDDALVCKLDLTDNAKYIFLDPIPEDDIKKNRWNQKKKEFEKASEEKASEEKDKAVKAITAFKDIHSGKGTEWTDLVNAFDGVKPQLESEQFKNYTKRFIVYSDFRETRMKDLKKLTIDLKNVTVEGRFVSKNEYETLDGYEKNKSSWQQILKCSSLTFKTPEETIK